MVSPERMYDLFVGDKKNHILYQEVWKRNFFPITITSIIRHMRHDMAIGSYPIYKQDGETYCRWVCIDIDSHALVPQEHRKEIRETYDDKTAKLILKKLEKEYKKRVNLETKTLQEKFVRYLYENSYQLLWIPNKYMVLEDSVGGFHLWIFLKDKTLLEDVGKLIYEIKPIINEEYRKMVGEMADAPEFYPKQYCVKHLNKGMGNAVRLPLGYNFGKEAVSKILAGDLQTVERFDVNSLIQNVEIEGGIESMNGIHATRTIVEVYDAQDVDEVFDFWLEFPIRECFKMIIRGETQCFGEHGHFMRMALVHELKYIGMAVEQIYFAFKNQYDFDEEITKEQIRSVLTSTTRKDGRYSCDKIKQLGYCHGCNDKDKE
jgi:hypothetical protein